jgi:hypothetical protein
VVDFSEVKWIEDEWGRKYWIDELGNKWEEYIEDNLTYKSLLLKHRYAQIPNLLLMDKDTSPQAKLIYSLMLQYVRPEGRGLCFPLQKNIANKLGMTENAVQLQIAHLKQNEWLEVERKGLPARAYYFFRLPSKRRIDSFVTEGWGISREELEKLLEETPPEIKKPRNLTSPSKKPKSKNLRSDGTRPLNNKGQGKSVLSKRKKDSDIAKINNNFLSLDGSSSAHNTEQTYYNNKEIDNNIKEDRKNIINPHPSFSLVQEKNKSQKNNSRKQQLTEFPPAFGLSDKMKQYALEKNPNLDVEEEFEKFRDYHLAKGSKFKDWEAAFRTWVRNTVKWNNKGNAANKNNGSSSINSTSKLQEAKVVLDILNKPIYQIEWGPIPGQETYFKWEQVSSKQKYLDQLIRIKQSAQAFVDYLRPYCGWFEEEKIYQPKDIVFRDKLVAKKGDLIEIKKNLVPCKPLLGGENSGVLWFWLKKEEAWKKMLSLLATAIADYFHENEFGENGRLHLGNYLSVWWWENAFLPYLNEEMYGQFKEIPEAVRTYLTNGN